MFVCQTAGHLGYRTPRSQTAPTKGTRLVELYTNISILKRIKCHHGPRTLTPATFFGQVARTWIQRGEDDRRLGDVDACRLSGLCESLNCAPLPSTLAGFRVRPSLQFPGCWVQVALGRNIPTFSKYRRFGHDGSWSWLYLLH